MSLCSKLYFEQKIVYDKKNYVVHGLMVYYIALGVNDIWINTIWDQQIIAISEMWRSYTKCM